MEEEEHKKIRNGFMCIYVSMWRFVRNRVTKTLSKCDKNVRVASHPSLMLLFILVILLLPLGGGGGGVFSHLARNTNNINNVPHKFSVC